MHLRLPYPPTVNTYWRHVVMGGKHPRVLISAEGREYKQAVGDAWVAQGMGGRQPLQGRVHARLCFYRPRKVGDLDNLLKAPLDALKGLAFNDDSQLVEIHAERHDDKAHPRLEIDLWSEP